MESGRKRRAFPDALKLEAVAAVGAGRSISEVAAELGLADRLVRSGSAGPRAARTQAAARRCRRLQNHRRRWRDAWVRARPTRPPRLPAAARARSREDGARHLKASCAHLRPGRGPEVSYGFIRSNVADFPVQLMCEVLEVSRSGYYDWISRAESARAAADRTLAVEIRASRDASRGRYGSPRVHAELRAHGRRISRKRVARLMRGMGLAARRRRRFRRTTDSTHAFPVAPNLLGRDFQAPAPDRIWLADITYI